MYAVLGKNTSLLVAVLFLITVFQLAWARPHIEDELEELKPELGDVFTNELPEGYYYRKDLQDCHARFHKRSINEHRQAVFNGTSVNATEFPHMAVLGWRQPGTSEIQWRCGGSLITKRYVLSAAHCATDKAGNDGNPPDVVRMGDVDLATEFDDKYAQQFGVRRVVKHPDFVSRKKYNDLALIELDRDVSLTAGVCPACIWPAKYFPQEYSLQVAGFGATEFGGGSIPNLLKATLESVGTISCDFAYHAFKGLPEGIREDQLCASSPHSDTCQGDSGGPLQTSLFTYQHIAPFIVGVTSFGKSCGHGSYGVYQLIAPHISWIESVVRERLNPTECIKKYKNYYEPMQMDGETEAVDPYFSRVYLHWDDPKTDNLCGGTLVDYNVVITSAHCTYNSRGQSPTKVSIIDRWARITEIERHPDFKAGSFYNDVALIRLDKYVTIVQWISPTCLPYPSALPGYQISPETFSCRTPKEGFSNKLQIYISSKKRCDESDFQLQEEYTSRFSRGLSGRMSCYGTDYRMVPGVGEIDKGGPLLSRDETIIFGVNAYASDCGSFNPLITTDVAPLIPWIEQFVLKRPSRGPSELQQQEPEPLAYYDRALYVGSVCTTKDDRPGKCAVTTDCWLEVQRYKQQQVEPAICGFEKEKAVICCPN